MSRAAGRCRDEPSRRVEALRLGQSGVAEGGSGSASHLGRRSGEEGVGIAADPGEQFLHANESGVAHLLEIDLRALDGSSERRHRADPGGVHLLDVLLEWLERREGLRHASILHPPTDIRGPRKRR